MFNKQRCTSLAFKALIGAGLWLAIAPLSFASESKKASPPASSQNENKQLPDGLYQLSQNPTLGNFAFLVDKGSRKLSVYEAKAEGLVEVATYPTDMGKRDGPKTKANDFKTPEGIYFLESKLTQPEIPFDLYGSLAFTTNYPNVFDRRENKTGNGIWLHAIPDTIPLTRGSRGCVVVRNEVIQKLESFVRLSQTPILIFDKVNYISPTDHLKKRDELAQFLESWRSTWQAQDIDKYMDHYDTSFVAQKMNWNRWKAFKSSLKDKYKYVKVEVENPSLFENNKQIIIRLIQKYESDGHRDYGQKTIYAKRTEQGIKIIREDWAPLPANLITSDGSTSSASTKATN